MTSFHAVKCRRLANKHEASAGPRMQQHPSVPKL